jgi:hypothetical protein
MESKYLIKYQAPYIKYDFERFPGFYYRVPEDRYDVYKRVLRAFDENLEDAQERLKITFQSFAEQEYNEWRQQWVKKMT